MKAPGTLGLLWAFRRLQAAAPQWYDAGVMQEDSEAEMIDDIVCIMILIMLLKYVINKGYHHKHCYDSHHSFKMIIIILMTSMSRCGEAYAVGSFRRASAGFASMEESFDATQELL